MENEFFKRINLLYKELFLDEVRIKYKEGLYYVKNRKTKEWRQAKIHKGNTISAPTSRGTSCPLANIDFMLNNPGPYTINDLVKLAYNGEIHKYLGWVKGLWDDNTRRIYLDLLIQHKLPLHEHYIKDYHNAFYKSIRKRYSGKLKYRQFLLDMGLVPEEITGMNNLNSHLNEGRLIEIEINKLLNQFSPDFKFNKRFDNKLIPDIYIQSTNEAIDIKRHIRTKINKEIEKYKSSFSKVTVIFLLGSRTLETNIEGVRKVSIFKWIKEQNFFINQPPDKKTYILNKLEELVNTIDSKQAIHDYSDSQRILVNQIIELDKLGLTNKEIAGRLGYSTSYINFILTGKNLKEYSQDYSIQYIERQIEHKNYTHVEIPNLIKELDSKGLSPNEIAKEIEITKDMVNYHLRKLGISGQEKLKARNILLDEMFKDLEQQYNINKMFKIILNELIHKYPSLKFGTIKNYYYSVYKKNMVNK